MKNIKHHLLSLIFIILLLIFSLGTSQGAYTEFQIKNNTTSNLVIKINYFDGSLPDAVANIEQEFEVEIGKYIGTHLYSGNNISRDPSRIINKLVIYNENIDMIKEYSGSDIYYNNVFKLIRENQGGFFSSKEKRTAYYLWEITDDLFIQ